MNVATVALTAVLLAVGTTQAASSPRREDVVITHRWHGCINVHGSRTMKLKRGNGGWWYRGNLVPEAVVERLRAALEAPAVHCSELAASSDEVARAAAVGAETLQSYLLNEERLEPHAAEEVALELGPKLSALEWHELLTDRWMSISRVQRTPTCTFSLSTSGEGFSIRLPGTMPLEASSGGEPDTLLLPWRVTVSDRKYETWSPDVLRAATALVDAAGLGLIRSDFDVDGRLRSATGLPREWRTLVHAHISGQNIVPNAPCCP